MRSFLPISRKKYDGGPESGGVYVRYWVIVLAEDSAKESAEATHPKSGPEALKRPFCLTNQAIQITCARSLTAHVDGVNAFPFAISPGLLGVKVIFRERGDEIACR